MLASEEMRNLYAPWRMEYIAAEPQPGCLFCRVRQAPPEDDRENLVVSGLVCIMAGLLRLGFIR